jgi:hypothetical protein
MSDIDNQEQYEEAAPEAASPVQEPEQDESWRDEIRSRYGDDLDDASLLREVWKGYRHSERRLSTREQQQQQQQPEPEPAPPAYDPFDDLEPEADEAISRRYYATANVDPARAAQSAYYALLEGKAGVTPGLTNQLFAHWAGQDFLGAQQFIWEHKQYQLRQQLEAEAQQRYAPLMANHTNSTLESAVSMAASQRPDLDPKQNPQAQQLREAVYGFLVKDMPQLFQREDPISAQDLARYLVWGRDIVFGQQTGGVFSPPAQDGEAAPDPDAAKARAATTRPRGASAPTNAEKAFKDELVREASRLTTS